jgi:DNA gyrase inhibitor GyrI
LIGVADHPGKAAAAAAAAVFTSWLDESGTCVRKLPSLGLRTSSWAAPADENLPPMKFRTLSYFADGLAEATVN